MDVSCPQGVELILPFVNRKNYILIDDALTGFDQWLVDIVSTTSLRTASTTATAAVTVQAFAHLEDVELAIPTGKRHAKKSRKNPRYAYNDSDDVGVMAKGAGSYVKSKMDMKTWHKKSTKAISFLDSIRTSMGGSIDPKEIQEREANKGGVISNIASSASGVLNTLSTVPIIGSYAGVAAGVTSSIGKVASFFGFSRPILEKDPIYVKTRPFTNTSSTIGTETVDKLTLDPKQGVSINPDIIGTSGLDEMDFKLITQKECLFTHMYWDPADVVDTRLGFIIVDPLICILDPNVGGLEAWQLTPMAMATLPFAYWSGSIVYRFEIVCSAYHRGRIRILYEPDGEVPTNDYNIVHNRLIDIEETKTFEVAIPWAQTTPYRAVRPELDQTYTYPPAGIYSYGGDFYNGTVFIDVSNVLTSPDAASPVTINVYARAGEDFSVQQPSSTILNTLTFQDEVVALQSDSYLFGGIVDDDTQQNRNDVFFGEVPVSFRNLLKRYTKLDTPSITIGGADTDYLATFKLFDIPVNTGLCAQALWANPKRSFTPMSLLEWTRGSYAFMRGAFRYKYSFFTDSTGGKTTQIYGGRVDLNHVSAPLSSESVGSTSLAGNIGFVFDGVFTDAEQHMWNGKVITVDSIQPTVEMEVPYYHNARYMPAGPTRYGESGVYSPYHQLDILFNSGPNLSQVFALREVSTGEDFNLYHYMGPQVVYIKP
jgi:hypothetical protein